MRAASRRAPGPASLRRRRCAGTRWYGSRGEGSFRSAEDEAQLTRGVDLLEGQHPGAHAGKRAGAGPLRPVATVGRCGEALQADFRQPARLRVEKKVPALVQAGLVLDVDKQTSQIGGGPARDQEPRPVSDNPGRFSWSRDHQARVRRLVLDPDERIIGKPSGPLLGGRDLELRPGDKIAHEKEIAFFPFEVADPKPAGRRKAAVRGAGRVTGRFAEERLWADAAGMEIHRVNGVGRSHQPVVLDGRAIAFRTQSDEQTPVQRRASEAPGLPRPFAQDLTDLTAFR